jgi:hypothetical protein
MACKTIFLASKDWFMACMHMLRAHCMTDQSVLPGMQESIKASKDWFMACAAHAAGMAAQMAEHLGALPGYDSQLHVIYLANDVLLAGWVTLHSRQRPLTQARLGDTKCQTLQLQYHPWRGLPLDV